MLSASNYFLKYIFFNPHALYETWIWNSQNNITTKSFNHYTILIHRHINKKIRVMHDYSIFYVGIAKLYTQYVNNFQKENIIIHLHNILIFFSNLSIFKITYMQIVFESKYENLNVPYKDCFQKGKYSIYLNLSRQSLTVKMNYILSLVFTYL